MNKKSKTLRIRRPEPRPAHDTHRRRRFFSLLAASTLLYGALVSCTTDSDTATPCDELDIGDSGDTIMVLADRSSATLTGTLTELQERPEKMFSSERLGFNPADDQEGESAGIVILATYDAQGSVATLGTFDLRGVAKESVRRRLDAKRQGECLAAKAHELADDSEPADANAGAGDLLRALSRAAADVRSRAGDGRGVVIATGLGRSAIEQRAVTEIDLSDKARPAVFAELDRVGLVPDIKADEVGLLFLDPAEGAESAITATGVEAFALDLCERIGAVTCDTSPVVR